MEGSNNTQQPSAVHPGSPGLSPQVYQQQQQPYTNPSVPISKVWHKTKIVLGILSIIFGIIALGISIALVVMGRIVGGFIIWTAPPVVVAVCWQIAEFITLGARKGQRGIHPGAHVALHLLLWMTFILATWISAAWLVTFMDCDYYCQRYDGSYKDDSELYAIMKALVAFLGLLFLTHFILFVRACVETSKRNSMPRVIMVPQPMYYPGPSGYQHQSMPVQPPNAHYSGYYAPAPGQQEMKQSYPQATGNSGVTNQTGQPSQPSQPNGTTIGDVDGQHGQGQEQVQYPHHNPQHQVSPA